MAWKWRANRSFQAGLRKPFSLWTVSAKAATSGSGCARWSPGASSAVCSSALSRYQAVRRPWTASRSCWSSQTKNQVLKSEIAEMTSLGAPT